jgi:hypothetical protein
MSTVEQTPTASGLVEERPEHEHATEAPRAGRVPEAADSQAAAESVPDVEHYQHERYLDGHGRSRLLPIYYACKPLLPRRVQLAMRRRYAPRQAARSFPAWPFEPVLVQRRYDELRAELDERGAGRLPIGNYWPRRARFAYVLTHDVEGPAGVELIPRVRELERRYGCVSSWNFVAEDYPIPAGCFEQLRAEGCEIGLHGISHDCKLFQSRANFEADLPKIHAYLKQWDIAGFRSPATHRRAEWMHELGCLYDSSFPDSDPFEPQAGGCCSIHPFMFEDLVELPITLMQDHTLMEILRVGTIEPWVTKSEWLIRHHGLINLITHPDYLDTPERLGLYEEFLAFLTGRTTGGWHALPREVAEWWRVRTGLRVQEAAEGSAIVGGERDGGGGEASVAFARVQEDELLIDV